jgi:hypothetical protein
MSLEKVPFITLGTTTTREPENLLFLVKVTILSTFPKRWNIKCKISRLMGYIMCSMMTRRTVLGPPWMSCPLVTGVAGVDAGVIEFCVPVMAWAACRAACADAFAFE